MLLFFKGALLNDPSGILKKTGENTRAARRILKCSPFDFAKLLIQESSRFRRSSAYPATDLRTVMESYRGYIVRRTGLPAETERYA